MSRTTPAFRAMSATLAVVTSLYVCGGGYMRAWAAEARARAEWQRTAEHLRVEERLLVDPEGYEVARNKGAQERRKGALEELRKHAQVAAREAREQAVRAEVAALQRATPEGAVRYELARAWALGEEGTKLQARLSSLSAPLARALSNNPRKPGPPPGFTPAHVEPVRFAAPKPQEKAPPLAVKGQRARGAEEEFLPTPQPEDLAETPETRRTPEIRALAQRLQCRALHLYNFVHTTIRPELYYGSKKGAAATLAEGAGNDFDQAALLIALLRSCDLPARYEYSTLRLDLEQAQELTGEKTATGAVLRLARSGIPAGVGADGQSVLLERVYVNTFVPYGNWRGSGPGGEPMWIRLDAGMKGVVRTQGVDLAGLVAFDYGAYLSAPQAETPLEVFERQLLAAAQARNLCHTLDDAMEKERVEEVTFQLLPFEHQAYVVNEQWIQARLPPQVRHRARLELGGQAWEGELAELQHRRLAVRYVGATPQDEAALARGMENVVPYQVRVIPVVRLEGQELLRLPAVMPGTRQTLTVRVEVPGASTVVATHRLVAGSVYALRVSAGTTTAAQVEALRWGTPLLRGEDRDEAEAHLALALYAHRQETAATRLFALQRHGIVKDVLEGLAGRELEVEEVNGVPVALRWGSYVLDIARDSLTPVPREGTRAQVADLVKLAGCHGSALEHQVWEELHGVAAVSAVKVLQAARSQGVPVYKLGPDNMTDRARLRGFSPTTLADVDQALAAGWKVTLPEHPTSYQQYTRLEGYVLENPITGASAWKINSLLNGGTSSGPATEAGAADTVPACSCDEPTTNSTVNMANGHMRERWVDLVVPTVGRTLEWARTYGSRAPGGTELGYGWMSSLGMYLQHEPDGSITYFTEDWRQVRFAKAGLVYVPPPGWHLSLVATTSGWQLRNKHGHTWDFNTQGRLVRLAEPGLPALELVYREGRLVEVRDTGPQSALRFEYAAGKLVRVVDRAGRAVTYAYEGDGLVRATDVNGHSELYAYDRGYNLVRRTDKRGQVWTSAYDMLDRWIGSQDPLGHRKTAWYDAPNRRAVLVDAMGASWLRYHDAAGRPVVRVDPLGNREQLTWDADSNLLQTRDARGFVTTSRYDSRGNLLSRRTPGGLETNWTYEPTYSQVQQVNQAGLAPVTFAYDTAGRPTQRQDGMETTQFSYSPQSLLASVTAPGSAVTTFQHHSRGLLSRVVDPEGGATTLDYNLAGHLVRMTDALGRSRTWEVDAAGRMLAAVDASGARTEYTLDPTGLLLTVKDETGAVTQYRYDAAGRLVEVRDPLGGVTRFEYDAEGRQVARVDALNRRTEYRWDAAGRVVETVAPDGARTTLAYCADVSTQPCAEVDAEGYLTRREFDAEGNMVKETDPAGRVSLRQYDRLGRLTSSSGPDEVPLWYTYDHRGLLTSVHNPLLKIDYTYDARGNRVEVNAGGQRTTYTFDKANRPLTETNPLGITTATRLYDPAGQLIALVDGNGRTTRYEHDRAGRLVKVLFEDGTSYTYAYDPLSRRTLEANAHHERRMSYDLGGRLAQVMDVTLSRTIDYGYDLAGNRTSLRTEGLEQRFAYDVRDRLVAVWHNEVGPILLGYDRLGRRTWVKRPNGVKTTYTHDEAGQVLAIVHAKGTQVLQGFAYGYDSRRLRTSKTYADGLREVYGYDEAYRLVAVDYGTQRSERYTLDALGNRLTLTELRGGQVHRGLSYTYNTFNQLLTTTQTRPLPTLLTQFTYDRNGNLLSESGTGQVKSYTWDLDNRLKQVTTAGGPGAGSWSSAYDTTGLRVSNSGRRLLLEGSSILEEMAGTQPGSSRYLLNPQQLDDLLALVQDEEVYYPLADALGSIQAVADDRGALPLSFSYSIFGERTATGGTPQLDFGYTGREHDAAGIRYHRDRYADAVTGRWLQPDRLGFADGANLYQYVGGAPTISTDPSGQIRLPNSIEARVLALIASGAWVRAAEYVELLTGRVQSRLALLQAQQLLARANPFALNCSNVAKELYSLFSRAGLHPRYVEVVSSGREYIMARNLPDRAPAITRNGYHLAVRLGDHVYDAVTRDQGMAWRLYSSNFMAVTGEVTVYVVERHPPKF